MINLITMKKALKNWINSLEKIDKVALTVCSILLILILLGV
tara:strand:- start:3870 stop:3992 length:123 start_codon:yes stop_codon:yes gene_type:complete